MNRFLKIGAIIILLIVVIGGVLVWRNHKSSSPNDKNTQTTSTDKSIQKNESKINPPVFAAEGKIVDGFPTQLIQQKDPVVAFSATSTLKDGTIARNVSYASVDKMEDVYNSYLTYLTSNEYSIKDKQLGTTAFIYTSKGKEKVNVAIQTTPNNEVVVLVTYIK